MWTSKKLGKRLACGLSFVLGLWILGTAPMQTYAISWNIANGGIYSVNVPADSSYPDSGGELMDGVYASALLADNAWQGRFNSTSYSVTMDMGSNRTFQSFKADFFKYIGAAVQTPTQVDFKYSTNGSSYTTACSVSQQGAGVDIVSVLYACSATSPITARYVQMTVASSLNTWSFIDEWEVLTPDFIEPMLSGSFIQPQLADSWTNTEWEAEFENMQEVGIEHLILQWTANGNDNSAVYPTTVSGFTQNTAGDVVEKSLQMGDKYKMDIYIGLQLDHDWFVHYANNATWLDNQAAIAVDLVEDIWDQYGSYDSFKGWYLSFEVDNWNMLTATEWQRMVDFYEEVTDAIHTVSPGLPIMISPFYNVSGGQTPVQWQTMWEYILARTDIDIIALQDGVGAGHAATSDLGSWFAATLAAIDNVSSTTELWADTETFNLDFQPMDLQLVLDDMLAVEDYVTNYTSFSFNHYMSPQQVNPLYFTTYRDYVQSGIMDATAPTAPASLTATAAGSMTINLSWTASTDATGVVGYEVYRDNELVYKGYSNATSYSDSQLEPSTSYSYKVSAFDAAGNISSYSTSVSVSTSSGTTYSNNLSAGRGYTSSLAADVAYPDTGGVELTDGAFGTTAYSNVGWQGRNTGSPYSFTIDLGSSKSVKEVYTNFLQVKSVYVLLPSSVTFMVSSDNINFTTVGTVNKPAVSSSDQVKKYKLTDLSGVSGRYVKVEIAPASSAWTFIDEVQVRN
jgi:chitodextrinase